ncbi:MAG: FG-GAP repeat domain-containing protein [Limisphaerales bacterium]
MMTQLNVLLGLWVALELSLASVGAQTAIHLSDVTAQSGITFRHSDGSEGGHRYITESVASGLASFDYNGDGKIDLLFLNGLDPAASNPSAGLCALYRNDGNMQFSDVSDTAGLTGRAHHLGVCVGDYDNDRLPDIYLSNFGRDTLYRNLGNGRFADVTEQAGLGSTEAFGAGAAFLDMDGDGDLDI